MRPIATSSEQAGEGGRHETRDQVEGRPPWRVMEYDQDDGVHLDLVCFPPRLSSYLYSASIKQRNLAQQCAKLCTDSNAASAVILDVP